MNTERIQLNMTHSEADKVAYVLMSALRRVTMLPSERAVATDAANTLFDLIGYKVRTGSHGERIDLDEHGKPVKMVCDHPGLFALANDNPNDTRWCSSCDKDVPVSQL